MPNRSYVRRVSDVWTVDGTDVKADSKRLLHGERGEARGDRTRMSEPEGLSNIGELPAGGSSNAETDGTRRYRGSSGRCATTRDDGRDQGDRNTQPASVAR